MSEEETSFWEENFGSPGKNWRQFLFQYRFPLILGAVGFLLFLSNFFLLVRGEGASKGVIFQTSSSPSGEMKIKVDVAGAVNQPGVYEFFPEERVADALRAAGGLADNADKGWLARNFNLAAKLIDGGKIYVPFLSETKNGKENLSFSFSEGKNELILGKEEGKLNLNSATQSQLEELPGVGPVTAVKIINGRPYRAVEDLKSRGIVGKALFEKIKDKITVY